MSSSSSSETPNTHNPKPESEAQNPPISPQEPHKNQETEQQEQEEEEGECPFCAFMKAGACKETFIEWEKCVEEGEKNNEDIVEKCFKVTDVLKKCMEANTDHYGPILDAQNAAEKIALDELEKEKESDREKEAGVAAVEENQEK